MDGYAAPGRIGARVATRWRGLAITLPALDSL